MGHVATAFFEALKFCLKLVHELLKSIQLFLLVVEFAAEIRDRFFEEGKLSFEADLVVFHGGGKVGGKEGESRVVVFDLTEMEAESPSGRFQRVLLLPERNGGLRSRAFSNHEDPCSRQDFPVGSRLSTRSERCRSPGGLRLFAGEAR